MALRTHAISLTSSEQTVLTVPEGQEGTVNSLLVTGTGALTLKFFNAATNSTYTVFNGKTVTDQIALERSFNLSSGDRLLASDDGSGLSLFASVYYVGSTATSAVLAYGPGPQELVAGDMSAGYFGEVSAAEFYSGDRLAFELGVTEGVLQNSTAGWLKFAHKGKVLFVAKRTFMHSVRWDHLYARGIVYGTNDDGKYPRGTPVNQYTTVEHGGNRFIARLLTGATTDPTSDSDPLFYTDGMAQLNLGSGSEWNELIYRVHTDVPTDDGNDGQRADRHGGPQMGANWANFSNADLAIQNGDCSWCQEALDTSALPRIHRGVVGLSAFVAATPSTVSGSNSTYQWRPVLELIPNN